MSHFSMQARNTNSAKRNKTSSPSSTRGRLRISRRPMDDSSDEEEEESRSVRAQSKQSPIRPGDRKPTEDYKTKPVETKQDTSNFICSIIRIIEARSVPVLDLC